MGLNISGLVLDKNYKNDLSELEAILGQKLHFEKEVIFEETLESWKEDSYCDIYFSEKGTFILLSMEQGGFEFWADDQVAFSFVLSEMTMMFSINYTQNDELRRSILVSEEMSEDEGEPFDFEKENDDENDKSELIFHLFEETMGESFDDIDLEATCFRYSFQELENIEAPFETENVVSNQNNTPKSEQQVLNKSDKPWWKFW